MKLLVGADGPSRKKLFDLFRQVGSDPVDLFKFLAFSQGRHVFLDGKQSIRSPPISPYAIRVGSLGRKKIGHRSEERGQSLIVLFHAQDLGGILCGFFGLPGKGALC